MQFNLYDSEEVQAGLDLWLTLEGEINPNDNGGISIFGINSRWNKEAVAKLSKIQDPISRMEWAKRYLFSCYWPKEVFPTVDACLLFHLQKAWSTPFTRSLSVDRLRLLVYDPSGYEDFLETKFISGKGVLRRLQGLKTYLRKFDL